jgi:2-polyprenyl-3-methyl-5-hydroxy-6-metoxy-1,4-benzoquinol methylase
MAMERVNVQEHNRAQIEYFEHAGKRAMQPTSSSYVERQVDELVRFGGLTEGERVLDVGCGMGRYTFPLAERGLRVEGLDLSQTLLDRLEVFNAGRYEIPLHCADVIDLPGTLDGQFDAVVGFFTLHHLHDLPASFAAMAGLVRPGGRVVFLEPNPLNVLYYAQIVVAPGMTWQGDKGILKMRPHTVFPAMEGAGLTSLRLMRFGLFPPFVTNRSWGLRLERVLERVRLWHSLLAFQLFRGDRRVSPARGMLERP